MKTAIEQHNAKAKKPLSVSVNRVAATATALA
jgi:hypothetical protein